MTRYMLRFMEERGVKALLVACNTISCLIDRYRGDMTCPVLSVVEAGADAVSQMAVHKVGVISTCFTHSTRCYPDLIGKKAPDKEVVSHGCPDLAKLVEANVGDPAGQGILDADIQANMDALVNQEKIDCCVLGCTHYPLVEKNIQRLYPGLPLIDPADQMAKTIAGLPSGERPGQRPAGQGHPGHLHHRQCGGVPGEGRQGGPQSGDLGAGLPHFEAVICNWTRPPHPKGCGGRLIAPPRQGSGGGRRRGGVNRSYRGKTRHIVAQQTQIMGEMLLCERKHGRAGLSAGLYIIENKATVRAAARKFNISKSTVHKDLSERLPAFNRTLYLQAKQVLEENKAQRHIRGGMATRRKYKGV